MYTHIVLVLYPIVLQIPYIDRVCCWLKLSISPRADKETAARITEEIGNLMKEIETLVDEKNKDSTDLAKIVQEGANHFAKTCPRCSMARDCQSHSLPTVLRWPAAVR